MKRFVATTAAVLAGLFLAGADAPPKPGPPAVAVDFDKDVRPVLEAKCVRCHGEKSKKGKLDVRTRAAMLKGGVTGPAIVPGNAEKSLLVELIDFNEMPPKKDGQRVTEAELKLLKAWIDAGAPEPTKKP
jgi:uncharacterized membrane protein